MAAARISFSSCFFVLAALILSAVGCGDKHPAVVHLPPPVVEFALPIERTVTDCQVFTARTQAVQSVDLKARVLGYLTHINFKDGAMVKEGDVLFQIDDRPYKAGALGSGQGVAGPGLPRLPSSRAQAEYDIALDVQKQDKGAISLAPGDQSPGIPR